MPRAPKLASFPAIRGALRFYVICSIITGVGLLLLVAEMILKYTPLHVELFAPSHGDRRTAVSLREKKSGVVQETTSAAGHGAAESMWEGFHAFVVRGREPISGAASELARLIRLDLMQALAGQ